MATPLTNLLAAVAIMATVYCVVAKSGNARMDDMRAVALVPAELVQWHSGFTVTGDSGVKPEWRSTLNAVDAQDARAFLVMHGAVGIRDVAEDRIDYSLDSLDAPKGARKSARNPTGTQDGSAQRGR
jgi:succinate dehydrogenase hydrophobic anchor subunit